MNYAIIDEDMEVIAASRNHISRLLSEPKEQHTSLEDQDNKLDTFNHLQQTQCFVLANADRDKHINKILKQQSNIKTLIEKDSQIIALRKSNAATRLMVENLREQCAKIALNSMNHLQELTEDQQEEIEKYKVEATKSIANEVKRHAEILENKEKDCIEMRKAVKIEEESREEYLRQFTEKLERELEQKKSSHFTINSRTAQKTSDPFDEEDDLQLCSVDEYRLYGSAKPSTKRATRKNQKT